MHVVKVASLLVLTLAVMRGGSWLIGWMAFRFAKTSVLPSTLIGNASAFGLFIGFLMVTAMSGEVLDRDAAVFGLVVFGVYQLIDLKWWPWRRPGGP